MQSIFGGPFEKVRQVVLLFEGPSFFHEQSLEKFLRALLDVKGGSQGERSFTLQKPLGSQTVFVGLCQPSRRFSSYL